MITTERQMMPVYQGSIYSLLQQSVSAARSGCFVLAMSSAHSGSGVSYLTALLVESLNRDLPGCAAAIDCRQLSRSSAFPSDDTQIQVQGDEVKPPSPAVWRSSPEFRQAYVQGLRDRFSYVVLDCPPLSESSEVLGLSQVVDGIVSVVEANRTTKYQIAQMESAVYQAGGKLLGHILNKQTMLLPPWLNARLERLGV